jgi:hypothetical protein
MKYNNLWSSIQQLSTTFQQSAAAAINSHLTLRNWLIGMYIVEFEQQGEDRARYGARLLQDLAEKLNEEGLSYRNLRLYRQFYVAYPQVREYLPQFFQKNIEIWQTVSANLQIAGKQSFEIWHTVYAKLEAKQISNWHTVCANLQNNENQGDEIGQTVSAQFEGAIGHTLCVQLQTNENQDIEIGQTPSVQFKNGNLQTVSANFSEPDLPRLPADKLIHKLSFSHIKLLLPIDNPLKRLFYEIECIKGTWSVRELKRQVDSLYFERSGMSKNPNLLRNTHLNYHRKNDLLNLFMKSF